MSPRMGQQTGTLGQISCREIKKLNRAESQSPLDKGQEHLQDLKEQLALCRGADLTLGKEMCKQTVPSSGSRYSSPNCPQWQKGSGPTRLQPHQSHRKSSTPVRAAPVLQLVCGELVIYSTWVLIGEKQNKISILQPGVSAGHQGCKVNDAPAA